MDLVGIIVFALLGLFIWGFYYYGYLGKRGENINTYPHPDKMVRRRRAENIVNKYGEAIASNPKTFKPESALPCPKEKIRSNIFRYISIITEQNIEITDDFKESLVSAYGAIDAFIPDKEARRLNNIGDNLIEASQDEKEEYFNEIKNKNAFGNLDYRQELRKHIEDCITK